MKYIAYFLIVFLSITSCSFNKVVKKHGIRNLEKKQNKLIVNVSNTNDIKELLGPPSVESIFDNDLWFYIEREISHGPIFKLGEEMLTKNNVLIIEINSKGLMISKEFINLEKMNLIEFEKKSTEQLYTKKSFIYNFLSSMRQKINDPLGKREKP